MDYFDARSLYEAGLGDSKKVREFFAGLATDRDAAALTALGENGEPAARKVLIAAKEEIVATIASAEGMAAEEEPKSPADRQRQLELLKSQLRRQREQVVLAHKLACEEEKRFEEVKARFGQRLDGSERATVTLIAERVAAGRTMTDREAEFLQKVGFGEKHADEVLAGKLRNRGVERLLEK